MFNDINEFIRGPEDASDIAAHGSKMGIDARRKWPPKGFTRPWLKKISTTRQAAAKADARWETICSGWKP